MAGLDEFFVTSVGDFDYDWTFRQFLFTYNFVAILIFYFCIFVFALKEYLPGERTK